SAAMPVRSFSEGYVVDSVNRAIAAWQAPVGGRIPVSNSGLCRDSVKKHDDNESVVGFGPTKDEKGKALLGITHKRTVGNRIVEADVELSTSLLGRRVLNPSWMADRSPTSCLSQTLMHEIGHVIGMDHAPEDTISVMTPGAVCVRITELPRADAENVRLLYP
ncbi:MAG TPA: matrixin family metalloprotease, partial [Nonomuraea sp.]|nr:matrixin family metalloprotease [Nonomuraea sp.]